MKSKEELIKKCNEIIDSLKGYSLEDKYKIITELYSSFMDVCEREGINFVEIKKL